MHLEIKELYNLSFDGDEWGGCMAFHFACADILYHVCEKTPPNHWRYSPGLRYSLFDGPVAGEDYQWPDSAILDMLNDKTIDTDDLIQAGNVFQRYAQWLKYKGKDY